MLQHANQIVQKFFFVRFMCMFEHFDLLWRVVLFVEELSISLNMVQNFLFVLYKALVIYSVRISKG